MGRKWDYCTIKRNGEKKRRMMLRWATWFEKQTGRRWWWLWSDKNEASKDKLWEGLWIMRRCNTREWEDNERVPVYQYLQRVCYVAGLARRREKDMEYKVVKKLTRKKKQNRKWKSAWKTNTGMDSVKSERFQFHATKDPRRRRIPYCCLTPLVDIPHHNTIMFIPPISFPLIVTM